MSLTLASCTVGPDFIRPQEPASDAYLSGEMQVETTHSHILHGHAQRLEPTGSFDGDWWHVFQSARLTQLIDQALANSPTVEEAFARVREADALYMAKRSGAALPRLMGGVTGERTNGLPGTSGSALGQVVSKEGVSLLGSFRLDMAGRTRRELEVLAARANTRQYEALAARRDMTHEIVVTAIQQARLLEQLRAESARRGAFGELLSLTLKRLRLGHATRADVHAVQRDLRLSEQTVVELETDIETLNRRLAVLAGVEPSAYQGEPFSTRDFELPANLPVVIPSELVRSRPDILAAEALLEAATADYGVAVAALYPDITINATAGVYQLGAGGLFSSATQAWSLLAQLTAPLLDGELRGMQRVKLAAIDAAAAQYRGKVLSALADVADVLKKVEVSATNLSLANEAYKDTVVVVESRRTMHANGALSRASLLPELIALAEAEVRLSNAMADRLVATADLMRAMTSGERGAAQSHALSVSRRAEAPMPSPLYAIPTEVELPPSEDVHAESPRWEFP